ncbi:glycosyltransferase [Metabacillus halosaccharovorans]|uniref:glycosyltransferase n=1 Tax=Metabacillus halosaccharovorans TaxID=930124 RepID=UPI00203BAE3E|nr:glycosyltransferase [Metabacillus halosaccharovorans]MCM3443751.1 glycosyltransferase [Metabacillus halosaccharovorans]
MEISACLIVKNEEKHIKRCLDSFRHVVDEIIVVDTGSTDDTVKIAKEFGAKIYFYKWDNNFANARNFAIAKTDADWIIFLDADEYFISNTASEIPTLLERLNHNIDAVIVKRVNIDTQSNRVIDIDSMTRIFRGKNRLKYRNNIHENIYKDKGTLNVFDATNHSFEIHHTGYSKNVIKSKAERNIKLLLNNLYNNKENYITYYYLADCYMSLEQYDEAMKFAKMFIKSGQSVYGFNSKQYHNLIRSMKHLKYDYIERLKIINEAIERFPSLPDFYRYRGILHLEFCEYAKSLESFEKVIILTKTYKDIEMTTIPGLLDSVYYSLGFLSQIKNDYSTAVDYYIKSLHENKYFEQSFVSLMNILRYESPEEVILLLKDLYVVTEKEDMKFIVRLLSKLKFGKILLYFGNIWYKQFKEEDSTLMYMFLVSGNYDAAFRNFIKCYKEEKSEWLILYSVISALLSNGAQNIIELESEVECSSFNGIVQAFLGKSNRLSYFKDFKYYIQLITQLILLEETLLSKFIKLKKYFDKDISEQLGDVLKKAEQYELAIEQYSEAIKNKHNLFSIGYCNYKLGNYDQAVEYFYRAFEKGYTNNDLIEYITFMKQHQNINTKSINYIHYITDYWEKIKDRNANFVIGDKLNNDLMLESKHRQSLVMLFPECENVHLTKDIGMIPFILYKYYGYDSKLVCYNNGEYPYLNKEVKGLKLEFLTKGINKLADGNHYLESNSISIDILYLWGIYTETISWIDTYKKFNPKGKVYLKLDANVWWMNRLELDEKTLKTLKKCNVISVESQKLYTYLNKKWPLKIEYIPNGSYNFNNRPIINYEEKENTILTVGRLGTRQKATEVLFEGFRIAETSIPNWKLRLVGSVDESFKSYMKDFFLNYPEMKDRITFTGPLTDRYLLEEEFRRAKVFCLTSRNEGFPLVFTEAAMNGCFIISTNLDPAYDITNDEKYGRLFPTEDTESLAKIFTNICNDNNELKNVCEKIQSYANNNFNWIRICRKLDILIKLS